jgi:hypothetical protein
MYAFVNKTGENAVLIFRFDDMTMAIDSLQANGFTILESSQVYNL